jgi:hypothetical protein
MRQSTFWSTMLPSGDGRSIHHRGYFKIETFGKAFQLPTDESSWYERMELCVTWRCFVHEISRSNSHYQHNATHHNTSSIPTLPCSVISIQTTMTTPLVKLDAALRMKPAAKNRFPNVRMSKRPSWSARSSSTTMFSSRYRILGQQCCDVGFVKLGPH